MATPLRRIAVVAACPFPAPRGTPIRIFRLAEALANRGHTVDVITYHLGEPISNTPFGIHRIAEVSAYRKMSPGPSVRKIVQLDPMVALKLRTFLATHPVDIIHAHHYEGLLISSWAQRRYPVIYDAHTTLASELPAYGRRLPATPKRWLGYALDWRLPRRAEHIITVTSTIRDSLLDAGSAAEERVTVVGNGVELSTFDVAPRVERDVSRRPRVLVYTGNLAPYQGVDHMLRAFAVLRRLRQDVELLVVTDSPFADHDKLARKLGVREAINVCSAPFAQIPALLADADAAINPRTECAGIPQKLLNYMAAGKAIVSFEGSAVCLTNELSGLCVKDGDADAMAKACDRVLSDRVLAQRLGKAARDHVRCEFSWDRAARQAERVYDKVLNPGGQRS